MPPYTPKYGIIKDDLLNKSRFISSYTSLVKLEAAGIWFIYTYNWSDTNRWMNVWVDNWGSIWKKSGSIHSNGMESIGKVHEGFPKPMSDMCIENIVSKKWPLPKTQQTDEISNALKAYVTMFQELRTLQHINSVLKVRISFLGEDIVELEETVKELTAELNLIKFAEPIAEIDLVEFPEATDTLDDLLSFFEPSAPA